LSKNFFPDFDEHMEECNEDSQRAYELKLLKVLYKALFSDKEFFDARLEAGEDFDLNWFNDTGTLAMFLFARKKVTVTPAQVLSTVGFTKTQLWDAYFTEQNKLRKDHTAAMIFPIAYMGQFVIHNSTVLDITPGYNVVTRVGGSSLLRIEPLAAFVASLVKRFKS
jgi:hypothetical protein